MFLWRIGFNSCGNRPFALFCLCLDKVSALSAAAEHLFWSFQRLYAFDVHCNSFFPMFVLLYGTFQVLSLVLWLAVEDKICDACISWTDEVFLVAVIHYFLSPLLLAHGFIPVLLSNLLFMVAVSYYHYLNFLGYDGKFQTCMFFNVWFADGRKSEPYFVSTFH